jgi:hypothetical protein
MLQKYSIAIAFKSCFEEILAKGKARPTISYMEARIGVSRR